MEKQYHEAETALFGTVQRADESNDSYLARADVQWMKLLAQKLKVEDLQAYVVLRGSQLSPEDKKKVILESDSSLEGKLTMTRVNEAVRLLGAHFFQDMTGGKRTTRTKVYEQSALLTETHDDDGPEDTFATGHDDNEDEFIDGLAHDGDEDATLVADFELAASETLQDDPSLAEAFNAYQDARRRLSEKFRNRGFWPTSKGSYHSGKGRGGKFNKGKGGKNAFDNRPRRSLQDRILNSNCRICGRKGHWRAECPYKGTSQGSTAGSTTPGTAPTTTVVTENADDEPDVLPMEVMQLPMHRSIDQDTETRVAQTNASEVSVFHVWGQYKPNHKGIQKESSGNKGNIVGIGHDRLQARLSRNKPAPKQPDQCSASDSARSRLKHKISVIRARKFQPELIQSPASQGLRFVEGQEDPPEHQMSNRAQDESHVCFATYGAMGVLDLGASKTVIGSEHVAELLDGLSPQVRKQVTRCACHVTFRFGNQGTLQSKHAIMVPIGSLLLKVAIVPGGTPFLLSNSLMRALSAQIDCRTNMMHSPLLRSPIKLTLTAKGLFLINLSELALNAIPETPTEAAPIVTETFVSEEAEQKMPTVLVTRMPPIQAKQSNPDQVAISQNSDQPKIDNPHTQPLKAQEKPCQFQSRVNIPSSDNEFSLHESTNSSTSVNHSADRPSAVLNASEPIPDATSVIADHVASTASPGHAGEGADADQRPGPPDPGATCSRGRGLRRQAQGEVILRGVARGSGVGHVHGESLPGEHEAQSQEVSPVCRHAADRTREDPDAGPRDQEGHEHDSHQYPKGGSKSKGQDLIGLQHPGPRRLSTYWGFRGRMAEWRDVRVTDEDYEPRSNGQREHSSPARSHAEHGASPEPCHPVHRGEEPAAMCGPVSEMLDAQAESHTAMHADRRTLNSLIIQISKEFEDQLQQTKPLGSRWEVGEIFCSSQSPIIQQIHNLGAKGFRFGYQEGDLSTKEGRGKLFRMIGTHRPRSIWYSPVCGPWSSWSNLNASLSLQHWQDHQALRHDMLYQLAMGIVLYRHQVSNGDHMHWEQPSRSLMFKQPGMSELQEHMQTCEFDMCQAGGLRDPVNKMFMKKAMQLMTTSPTMYQTLHGMKCNHQHEHQTIEGTTYNDQGAILRTKFSEVYPRKFARTIAKTMMRLQGEKPFHWNPKIHLRSAAEPDQPIHAATTGSRTVRDRFPRSELICPLPETETMAKRRRINGKHSPHVTKEMCEQFMKTIQQELPRVGKREIRSNTAWSQIQEIFHDKEIVRIIACRGTDRTLGPPTGLHHEEAPYRRTIMEIRETKEIKFEAYWERWDQLSNRQLIRPAHPCKINVTVFGRDRYLNSAPAVTPPVGNQPIPHAIDASADVVPGSPPQVEEPVIPAVPSDVDKPMQQSPTPTVENPAPDSELTEARLRFQSLAPWEKQMLRQMHTNLGHPSNERLCKALQTQGYRPEIIQAARELTCVTCAKCSPPKHQRPAALKQVLDFNHKIYLDAINWTNKVGKTLHFYHILDAGSSYHVAIASPSNTSTNIIRLLQQHWCSWAGIPSELVVDSGTELNSQEFQNFLQQYGIRCTTTNPEAHWQNGRVERHGSFLQSMLSRVDQEMGINDYHDLQASLNQCTSAKNMLSTRHGYSPEIIVFGRQSRLPGSILNDEGVPSHLQALQEKSEVSIGDFKRTLQLRETARRAYHAADNCDALRKAVLRRSCPHRGQYERGSWVMIWRTINVGEKKWLGPQRVIIQDGNHTVWTTQCGRIYRSAPENVRPSMPEEGQPEGPDLPEDVTPHEQQIQFADSGTKPR